MIGQTKKQIANDNNKELTAIKDAIVTILFVLLSGLIIAGYPPTMQVLYTSLITGLFMGLTSYMNAIRIKKPEQINI